MSQRKPAGFWQAKRRSLSAAQLAKIAHMPGPDSLARVAAGGAMFGLSSPSLPRPVTVGHSECISQWAGRVCQSSGPTTVWRRMVRS